MVKSAWHVRLGRTRLNSDASSSYLDSDTGVWKVCNQSHRYDRVATSVEAFAPFLRLHCSIVTSRLHHSHSVASTTGRGPVTRTRSLQQR